MLRTPKSKGSVVLTPASQCTPASARAKEQALDSERWESSRDADPFVVLTPAKSTPTSVKGQARDSERWESLREWDHDDSEHGRNCSWGQGDKEGWRCSKGEVPAKSQLKGNTKSSGKVVSEAQRATDAKSAGAQPRVRDEIQEEVDAVVWKNSNLMRSDFDGRVFQYLHAVHGIGGREKVRQTLENIHLSTLDKQRSSIKKWPAYLITLLKNAFDDLKAEQKRVRLEAETYAKQLPLSVDALFEKPVEIKVPGGPKDVTSKGSGNAANPQEPDHEAQSERVSQGNTKERDQQWLDKASNLLREALFSSPEQTSPSDMHKLPAVNRSIPPGFTPPQVDSPKHGTQASGDGSLLASSSSSPQHPSPETFPGLCKPPLQPPPLPPPPPPPLPPTAFRAPDPFKQQPPGLDLSPYSAQPQQFFPAPSQPPPPPPPPPPPLTAFHAPDPYKQQPPGLDVSPYSAQPQPFSPQGRGSPHIPSHEGAHHQQQPRVQVSMPPGAFHTHETYKQESPGLAPPQQPQGLSQQRQGPSYVTSPPAAPSADHQRASQPQRPRVVPPPRRQQQVPQMQGAHAPLMTRPPPPPTAPPTQPEEKVVHESPWSISKPTQSEESVFHESPWSIPSLIPAL